MAKGPKLIKIWQTFFAGRSAAIQNFCSTNYFNIVLNQIMANLERRDPYFRSREPTLAEQRGTGLGLRFVKTVVERHGGSIRVISEFGVGSQFVVTLPKTEV